MVMQLVRVAPVLEEDAQIRAGWCASLVAAVAELASGDREGIPATLDAELREAIAAAGEIGWIPAARLLAYLDAALEVVGDERLFDLIHAALLTGKRSPLPRRTCASAVRLFGAAGIVHGMVPAWQLVTRGCAELRAAEIRGPVGVDVLVVEFAGSNELLAGSWAWAAMCRAWLQASVDAVGVVGLVEQRQAGEAGALRYCVYVTREARRPREPVRPAIRAAAG